MRAYIETLVVKLRVKIPWFGFIGFRLIISASA